jgi:hypothetical protein
MFRRTFLAIASLIPFLRSTIKTPKGWESIDSDDDPPPILGKRQLWANSPPKGPILPLTDIFTAKWILDSLWLMSVCLGEEWDDVISLQDKIDRSAKIPHHERQPIIMNEREAYALHYACLALWMRATERCTMERVTWSGSEVPAEQREEVPIGQGDETAQLTYVGGWCVMMNRITGYDDLAW